MAMDESMPGAEPAPAGAAGTMPAETETETETAETGAARTADVAPAGPQPLGVGRTPTGNAEVDALLERLGDADHLTPDGHIEVYEDVHRGLRDALTALDTRPGPPAPAPGAPRAPHTP
ncbi:hypothetical protein ACH429_24775 [Streptomyces pathocidini]|uniref:Uncharacterized protein n=1 Tax=Streptomyces pathocidini TaxID=1650571 RepID=A0ABW7UXG9_9ACTN